VNFFPALIIERNYSLLSGYAAIPKIPVHLAPGGPFPLLFTFSFLKNSSVARAEVVYLFREIGPL